MRTNNILLQLIKVLANLARRIVFQMLALTFIVQGAIFLGCRHKEERPRGVEKRDYSTVDFDGRRFTLDYPICSDQSASRRLGQICVEALRKEGLFGHLKNVYLSPKGDSYIVTVAITSRMQNGQELACSDVYVGCVVDKAQNRLLYIFFLPMI
jgi:hypothetical protein